MIKTRLLKLLFHAKKYIVYQVIWKWIALLGQVVIVLVISMLLEKCIPKYDNRGSDSVLWHSCFGRCYVEISL